MGENSLPKRILFGFITFFAIFMIFEFGLRIYDIGSGRIFFTDLMAHFYNLTLVYRDPYLDYTSNRGYDGEVPMMEPGVSYTVKINSSGFRTREFYPKTPNVVRVAILGDSYMYGYGANQDETTAAVLEKKLRTAFSNNVEVHSFGIASYSGITYALIARNYFEFLKPDIVITCVDQSDFEGDLALEDKYLFDENGAPLILRNYQEIADQIDTQFNRNDRQQILDRRSGKDWIMRLRAGSSTLNFLYGIYRKLKIQFVTYKKNSTDDNNGRDIKPGGQDSQSKNNSSIVRYEDLVEKFGTDLRNTIADNGVNNIPVDLETAKQLYGSTFNSLKFVKKMADEIGAKFYLSSYPLPWFVTIKEAKSFQLGHFGKVLDFRNNRIYPRLMDSYAVQLGTKNLDSHAVFENSTVQNYGNFDPHFNAHGYALYADFLFNSIKGDVAAALKIIEKN